MEFPLMLLKPGTAFEWDGAWYDHVIVADQDELDIALADGWSLGKPGDAPAEEAPVKRKPGRPAKIAEGVTDA